MSKNVETISLACIQNRGAEPVAMSSPIQNKAGESVSQNGMHPAVCSNTLECLHTYICIYKCTYVRTYIHTYIFPAPGHES